MLLKFFLENRAPHHKEFLLKQIEKITQSKIILFVPIFLTVLTNISNREEKSKGEKLPTESCG